MCRTTGAPLPKHAMGTRTSRGLMPMVLAGRTPREPPSLPPEPTPRYPKNRGPFLEGRGDPRGAQHRPLFATTGPSTLESGLGATCGVEGAQERACTSGGGLAAACRKSEGWIDWQECRGAAAQGVDEHRVLTMNPVHGAGALVGAGEARGGQEGSSTSVWAPTSKNRGKKNLHIG